MLEELFLLSQHFLQTGYRKYHRIFLSQLKRTNRLSIITGQRGIGKTTAMIQFLRDATNNNTLSKKHLYVQSDHFAVGNMKLYTIAQAFRDLGGKVICFDEIHTYPDWSRELKSIHDTFQDLIVLATGSSALHIVKGSHDLSRRVALCSLHGFSLREYIELQHDIELPVLSLPNLLKSHEELALSIIETVEKKGEKILGLFKEYLEHGYYPFFQEYEHEDLFYSALERNIHTTIEKDLLALHPSLTGGSVRKIKQLLSFLASSLPFSPDLNQLKKICDIGDERTLKTYLAYLEDGGVITMVMKAGRKINTLEKPEKIYFNNANQLQALRPLDRNIGTVRESFCVSMLKPNHRISIPAKGDLLVDETWTFEIGGKNKGFTQIKNITDSFRLLDDTERGIGATIPLWMLGFLY